MDPSEDLLSELGQTLTCPSCRISIIPTRHRFICPFCGSFYDTEAENDIGIRSSLSRAPHSLSHIPSVDETDVVDATVAGFSGTHLPRIGPFPRLASSFGPLIADGLEVIHTYITGLLFRPTASTENQFILTLPPIAGNSSRDIHGQSHWLTRSARRRSSSESSVHLESSSSSSSTTGNIDGTTSLSPHVSCAHKIPSTGSITAFSEISYPNRHKSVSQFKWVMSFSLFLHHTTYLSTPLCSSSPSTCLFLPVAPTAAASK